MERTDEHGTRSVVEELLSRSGGGAPERIAELYAEDVDWRVNWPEPEHRLVPWIRPRATRADVADHFRVFGANCAADEGAVSVDEILVSGPDAVVFGRSSQVVKTTGERFEMTFALRLTVEGGLITRHHMYEDSLAVLQAFDRAPRHG
ncbi:nuclear transport factor 2 family protein [Saccharopolyspora shandongensis]|uniref:nuclear transport factor 2 family protein n=1 Tax=Saccharopolyspora shandongensis TaxID=418495 RepID=UPI00343DBA90